MTAIKNLCKTGIMLRNGTIDYTGQIEEVVNHYLADETVKGIVNNHWTIDKAPGLEKIRVKSAFIKYEGDLLTVNTPFDMITEFWCFEEGFPVNVSMHLFDINGTCVYNIFTDNLPLKKGLHKAVFNIPANLMNDGIYYVNNMFVSDAQCYYNHEHAHSFEIVEDREASGWHGKWIGSVRPTFIQNEYSYIESI
jgi:lipopolysaccharide transport system ATP-binding protein